MPGRPSSFAVGSMRQRCTIKTPTETLDSAGQPVVTWSTFLENEPCQFVPTGGTESMRGRQYTDCTRAVFRVRYRAGYSPLQKITYNGTDYGITYVNDVDGLRRYIELVCTS